MRSVRRKLLYSVVILSMVLSFVPRPLAAQAAPEGENRDMPPRAVVSDPAEHVRALLGDDPQTRIINAALGELPHDHWQGATDASPHQGLSPGFPPLSPNSLAPSEPARPPIPSLTPSSPNPAFPALPAPASPQVQGMASTLASLTHDAYLQSAGVDDEAALIPEQDGESLALPQGGALVPPLDAREVVPTGYSLDERSAPEIPLTERPTLQEDKSTTMGDGHPYLVYLPPR